MKRKIEKINRCADCKAELDLDEDEKYCNDCYLRRLEEDIVEEEEEHGIL